MKAGDTKKWKKSCCFLIQIHVQSFWFKLLYHCYCCVLRVLSLKNPYFSWKYLCFPLSQFCGVHLKRRWSNFLYKESFKPNSHDLLLAVPAADIHRPPMPSHVTGVSLSLSAYCGRGFAYFTMQFFHRYFLLLSKSWLCIFRRKKHRNWCVVFQVIRIN